MTVTVLYFGVLRERAGMERTQMELPAGTTARELLELLRPGAEDAVWKSLAMGINREFATPDRELAEGDEVALLPPVSGGAR